MKCCQSSRVIIKKVNNIFIYESNTSVETWADRIAVAPIAIDEEAPELIRDIWLNETDADV